MEQKHTSPVGSELDSLKEMVQNLSSANTQLTSANAQLTAENAELKRKLERMNELLLLAQRARFGQSSEKREYVMQGGDQLQLFNEAEACQNLKEPESTEETIVSEHTRTKPWFRSTGRTGRQTPRNPGCGSMPAGRTAAPRCGSSSTSQTAAASIRQRF